MRHFPQIGFIAFFPDQLDPEPAFYRAVFLEKVVGNSDVRRTASAIVQYVVRRFRHCLSVQIVVVIGLQVDGRRDLRVMKADRTGLFVNSVILSHISK